MNKLLITIALLSTNFVFAQNVDDLNKKELKNELTKCQSSSDSLANQNRIISKEKQLIESKINELENELKNAKTSLNTVIESNKDNQNRFSSINDSLSSCTKTKQMLLDSIAVLKKQLNNLIGESSTATVSPDFLNRYFQTPIALNNNSFKFSLKGLYLVNSDNNDYYNRNSSLSYIPELITTDKLSFYGQKPYLDISSIDSAEEALTKVDLNYVNSFLPRIEILKNKLVTLKYIDSSEANYLLNLKQGSENNYRKTIQIELASEDVKNDGTKYSDRDIIWKIFVLNNECYLALTYNQLRNIKYPLFNIEKGLIFESPARNDIRQLNNSRNSYNYYNYQNYYTSYGLYIQRKKDTYMSKSHFINPESAIFLFKLIED
jgi:hypothetical protein